MVYTRPSLMHWVCKDGLPSESSSANTGGTLEYCLKTRVRREVQKQKKGTYNSRGPEKVLQIAAFVLNVEDGVWKGCSKSQRTSNNSKPFIFSNENRETAISLSVTWRGWAQRSYYWHHAVCRRRWGGCSPQRWRDLYQLPSWSPSIPWFCLNVLLLPAPSASSGFLIYHCLPLS